MRLSALDNLHSFMCLMENLFEKYATDLRKNKSMFQKTECAFLILQYFQFPKIYKQTWKYFN